MPLDAYNFPSNGTSRNKNAELSSSSSSFDFYRGIYLSSDSSTFRSSDETDLIAILKQEFQELKDLGVISENASFDEFLSNPLPRTPNSSSSSSCVACGDTLVLTIDLPCDNCFSPLNGCHTLEKDESQTNDNVESFYGLHLDILGGIDLEVVYGNGSDPTYGQAGWGAYIRIEDYCGYSILHIDLSDGAWSSKTLDGVGPCDPPEVASHGVVVADFGNGFIRVDCTDCGPFDECTSSSSTDSTLSTLTSLSTTSSSTSSLLFSSSTSSTLTSLSSITSMSSFSTPSSFSTTSCLACGSQLKLTIDLPCEDNCYKFLNGCYTLDKSNPFSWQENRYATSAIITFQGYEYTVVLTVAYSDGTEPSFPQVGWIAYVELFWRTPIGVFDFEGICGNAVIATRILSDGAWSGEGIDGVGPCDEPEVIDYSADSEFGLGGVITVDCTDCFPFEDCSSNTVSTDSTDSSESTFSSLTSLSSFSSFSSITDGDDGDDTTTTNGGDGPPGFCKLRTTIDPCDKPPYPLGCSVKFIYNEEPDEDERFLYRPPMLTDEIINDSSKFWTSGDSIIQTGSSCTDIGCKDHFKRVIGSSETNSDIEEDFVAGKLSSHILQDGTYAVFLGLASESEECDSEGKEGGGKVLYSTNAGVSWDKSEIVVAESAKSCSLIVSDTYQDVLFYVDTKNKLMAKEISSTWLQQAAVLAAGVASSTEKQRNNTKNLEKELQDRFDNAPTEVAYPDASMAISGHVTGDGRYKIFFYNNDGRLLSVESTNAKKWDISKNF